VRLVDTSVWIDHFRRANPELQHALEAGAVAVHPFVVGELALGQLRQRDEILTLLGSLPAAAGAEPDEVLHFVGLERLSGSGIGWVDAHLLCACRLAGWRLWTADKPLKRQAARLGLT
jgi:predicted nucleic acid-binding protein